MNECKMNYDSLFNKTSNSFAVTGLIDLLHQKVNRAKTRSINHKLYQEYFYIV